VIPASPELSCEENLAVAHATTLKGGFSVEGQLMQRETFDGDIVARAGFG